MAEYDYDVLVIGSGPSGQRAAIQSAKLHKRVAVIERKAVVGGVCVNTGTIPSKTMREAVLHLSGYRYRNLYGQSYTVKQNITIADLLFRTGYVVNNEIEVMRHQMMRNDVELIVAEASFLDPHTVRLAAIDRRGHRDVTAESIILAGRHPRQLRRAHPVRRPADLHQRRRPQPRTAATVADGRRRGSDRLRVRLHLRHPRRSGDAGRQTRAAAAVRGPRDHGRPEIARGQIIGDHSGLLKLIFHLDTRELLGVHIIGEGASELVHIGQAVMAFGGKIDYFVDAVFNYPTLAECYRTAGFNGINRLSA